jgi:hypothetical protein
MQQIECSRVSLAVSFLNWTQWRASQLGQYALQGRGFGGAELSHMTAEVSTVQLIGWNLDTPTSQVTQLQIAPARTSSPSSQHLNAPAQHLLPHDTDASA